MSFKIAFDLDETLDHGTALARLCNALNRCRDVEITVLSARKMTEVTIKEKFSKVQSLGVTVTSKQLHVVQGETDTARAYAKGAFCRDNQIDLFIDNNRVYCDHVLAMSPHTTVLHRV
jgi:hypothetical protein